MFCLCALILCSTFVSVHAVFSGEHLQGLESLLKGGEPLSFLVLSSIGEKLNDFSALSFCNSLPNFLCVKKKKNQENKKKICYVNSLS
jgi:hypothetical protein